MLDVSLKNIHQYLPDYEKAFNDLNSKGYAVFWEYELICFNMLRNHRQSQEVMLDYWRDAPVSFWVVATENNFALMTFEEHVVSYAACHSNPNDIKRAISFFMGSPICFLQWSRNPPSYKQKIRSHLNQINRWL